MKSTIYLLATFLLVLMWFAGPGFAQTSRPEERVQFKKDSVMMKLSTDSGVQNCRKKLNSEMNEMFLRAGLNQPRFKELQIDTDSFNSPVPFSKLFKYDTSPGNPDHRCYEIVVPLSTNYRFLFNFVSFEKYNLGGS